jgi:signal transduction histidine kinase
LALRRVEEPGLRHQLERIAQGSQHLLAIIKDILDISKIEAEKLVLEASDFRLSEVVDRLRGLLGHQAMTKGIKLRIDVPAEMEALSLHGDAGRLGQILINLVGNALKFSKQGTVTVRIRQFAVMKG